VRARRPVGWNQQIGLIVVLAETASLIGPSLTVVSAAEPIVEEPAEASVDGNPDSFPALTGVSCFVSFICFLLGKINRAGKTRRAWHVDPACFVGIAERPGLPAKTEGGHDTKQRGSAGKCDPTAAHGAALRFDALSPSFFFGFRKLKSYFKL
jgi:hypothetical protein